MKLTCRCISSRTFSSVRWPTGFDSMLSLIDRITIEPLELLPAECLYGGRLGYYIELLAELVRVARAHLLLVLLRRDLVRQPLLRGPLCFHPLRLSLRRLHLEPRAIREQLQRPLPQLLEGKGLVSD